MSGSGADVDVFTAEYEVLRGWVVGAADAVARPPGLAPVLLHGLPSWIAVRWMRPTERTDTAETDAPRAPHPPPGDRDRGLTEALATMVEYCRREGVA